MKRPQTTTKQRRTRLLALLFVLVGLFAVLTILRPETANAVGTQYFDGCTDADVARQGGTCVDVRVLAPASNLVAYFRTKSGAEYIQFHRVIGGYSCGFDQASGGPIWVRVAGVTPPPNCSHAINVSSLLQVDPNTGLYYVPIHYYGGPGGSSAANSQVIITQGGGSPVAIAQKGDPQSRGGMVGLRTINYNPPNKKGNQPRFWADWYIPFGPDCNLPNGVTQAFPLSSHDLDQLNGPQNNQRLRAIRWQLFDVTNGSWQLVATHQPPDRDGQNYQWWVNITGGHRYMWVWRDVDSGNYIGLATPFDGILGLASCTYPVCPAAPGLALGTVEAGVPVNLPMRVNYSGSPPNVTSMTYRVTPPGGSATNVTSITGDNYSYVQGNASYTPSAAGRHTVQWTLTYNGTKTITCNGEFTAIGRPYLKVFGGDVHAGVDFHNGTTCVVGGGASNIWTYNRGTPNYQGTATQMAVFALGTIGEFASGSLQAGKPKLLTFANNNPGLAYGGGSGVRPCVKNYWEKAPTAPPTSHSITSPIVLGEGDKQDIFVEGDVYIGSDISYDTAAGVTWSSRNEIPSFRLIVKRGNIYINSSVKRLDGIYIAMPGTDPTKGRIFTCVADNIAPLAPTSAEIADKCDDNKLTVNGAFIAKQVKLLRTANSLSNATACSAGSENDCKAATSNAAEIFNYTPETWMAIPENPGIGNLNLDSFNNLPAIL